MPLPRLTPLLLAVAVTGCSGTPFGDQLSRSFSQPPAAPAVPPAKPAAAPAKPEVVETPKPEPKPVAAAQPLTPAPYRVTIKLPAADPSSPAEAVTDALRQAGVAFEVETIERVPAAGADSAAPLRTTPAPPAR
jgi:ABC-type transport system substrate-binding protein